MHGLVLYACQDRLTSGRPSGLEPPGLSPSITGSLAMVLPALLDVQGVVHAPPVNLRLE
jgi:hypothetical protein